MDTLHDSRPFPPLIVVSHGYENIYERGFCNGLSDNRFDFVLVSSDRTDYTGLREGTRTINLRGSQEEQRPKLQKALNLLSYHLRLMWLVLRHRGSAVHVMGLIEPPLLCGVIEGLWFRLLSRKYFLTAHNLLPHDRETLGNRILYYLAYHLAGNLVVHTQRVKDILATRHGISPDRILVMEHGIEPMASPPALPVSRAPGTPLRLVFFGKVLRYKGVDIALEALKDFPHPFHFEIAGGCWDEALRAELKAQIASHPQSESIQWRDQYIPENELEQLFLDADALVLPYRQIEQSGVLFQGLRFGLPIVATRVGSFDHYITDELGELADVEVPSLRDAFLRLQARIDTLSRPRIAALAKRYEWQTTVRALEQPYALVS